MVLWSLQGDCTQEEVALVHPSVGSPSNQETFIVSITNEHTCKGCEGNKCLCTLHGYVNSVKLPSKLTHQPL